MTTSSHTPNCFLCIPTCYLANPSCTLANPDIAFRCVFISPLFFASFPVLFSCVEFFPTKQDSYIQVILVFSGVYFMSVTYTFLGCSPTINLSWLLLA